MGRVAASYSFIIEVRIVVSIVFISIGSQDGTYGASQDCGRRRLDFEHGGVVDEKLHREATY